MRFVLTGLFLVLSVLSCTQAPSPAKEVAPPTTQSLLLGKWVSACFPDGPTSFQIAFEFSGNSYTYSDYDYSTANCTDSSSTKLNSKGTFEIVSTSSNNLGVIGINWTSVTDRTAGTTYDILMFSNQNNNLQFASEASSSVDSRPTSVGTQIFTRKSP